MGSSIIFRLSEHAGLLQANRRISEARAQECDTQPQGNHNGTADAASPDEDIAALKRWHADGEEHADRCQGNHNVGLGPGHGGQASFNASIREGAVQCRRSAAARCRIRRAASRMRRGAHASHGRRRVAVRSYCLSDANPGVINARISSDSLGRIPARVVGRAR
jgi:hypothetical protein